MHFNANLRRDLVSLWCNELEKLCSLIAKSQPQAAYCAFVHGYRHKFTYYLRTISNIADLLHPVEEIIATNVSPTLFDQWGKTDGEMFALHARLDGLGIPCLHAESNFKFNSSKLFSTRLVDLIVRQSTILIQDDQTMVNTRSLMKNSRTSRLNNSADSLDQCLPQEHALRTISLACDKGASGWLNVLPLEDEGYVLNNA